MICSLIVAASDGDVIGRDGGLPWHLTGDLRRFRALTAGHVVVMGRLTHESILARLGGPLPGRTSVVVSSRAGAVTASSSVVPATSVGAGLATAADLTEAAGHGRFFVGGGVSVYLQSLESAGQILLTRVHLDVDGDRRMPGGWLEGFVEAGREDVTDAASGARYSWLDYRRAVP